ncbi:MAG: ribokinase [Anaerolineales bacterium]|nr:ribokinase [Anaerolineales bacterium]
MINLLVVGSLNADLVLRAPRFPQPGETIHGEALQIIPGGKGANQATAAAKLGARVAIVGRVGSDTFAPFLLASLQAHQVDTTYVRTDSSASGTAIIVVDAEGQNSIVLSAGANEKVTPADVEAANGLNPSLLLLQLEIPIPTVLHAARFAKRKQACVILNPAPAQPLPDELISLADFIVPNESELSLLSGLNVSDVSSAESAAKVLLRRGAKQVIVTLGAKGALWVAPQHTLKVDSFPVHAVDTTAAGDAFIGGFAAKLLGYNLAPDHEWTQLEIQTAIRYACACGALAATKFGAQPSLPSLMEVEQFLKDL